MELEQVPLPKPLMRGWLHLAMTPIALIAGVVLIVLAPTVTGRMGERSGCSPPSNSSGSARPTIAATGAPAQR